MVIEAKALHNLTAGDLMSRNVLRLAETTSLRDAARLLTQNQIGGAPVVNATGKCVGVLSAADFVHLSAKRTNTDSAHRRDCRSMSVDWELGQLDKLPTEEVRCYMTADPVTCRPSASLRALCRMMIDAHVHRVVVVDDDQRPVGIISSTDVLGAVAYSEP